MNYIRVPSLLILLFLTGSLLAQKSQYKVACIGFYNLENLFDTVDDTLINDQEFLPHSYKEWTLERYEEKVGNMAYAISQMGIDKSKNGVSVLGVSEVENYKVLHDLVSHPFLKERNYGIVHYDSPDFRGIDVALLYQKAHFSPDTSYTLTLPIIENGLTKYTRDILYVAGDFDGERMHFMVNHWPSRRGGAAKTAPYRNRGAQICRAHIDSLNRVEDGAKVVVMGDLNDDPTSPSVKSHMRAKSSIKDCDTEDIFNPMIDLYRRGTGSNAWNDAWSLFDQVMLSGSFVDKNQDGFFYYQGIVFNKKFLIQKFGQYKGYPFRTFGGSTYMGGYSDHFPVFVYLLKAIKN